MFRLRKQKPACTEIGRVARELIDDTIAHIAPFSAPEGESVHKARKNIKKLRAILRLIRRQMGSEASKREDQCLRGVGRYLSSIRDAQVRLKTFQKLQGETQNKAAKSFQGRLMQDRERSFRKLHNRRGLERRIADLKSVRRRIQNWTSKELKKSDLKKNLRRIYKRSQRDFHIARKEGDTLSLHESRKRAKDLWYVLCLLKSEHPKKMKALADDMKDFTEQLGQALDLTLLKRTLDDPRLTHEARSDLQKIKTLIQIERAEQQKNALKLGKKFFSKPPRSFA